eukprot:scaffold12939_cov63-Phaeocystis_antarctica.AAC.2
MRVLVRSTGAGEGEAQASPAWSATLPSLRWMRLPVMILRSTWGATVRGTHGRPKAVTCTVYVLWHASCPAPLVRTARRRRVRVARRYSTEVRVSTALHRRLLSLALLLLLTLLLPLLFLALLAPLLLLLFPPLSPVVPRYAGTQSTSEAGTRNPYVQCVAPRRQLPCAYSTQEAGTCKTHSAEEPGRTCQLPLSLLVLALPLLLLPSPTAAAAAAAAAAATATAATAAAAAATALLFVRQLSAAGRGGSSGLRHALTKEEALQRTPYSDATILLDQRRECCFL